jgi:hypothetical protein
MWHQADAEERGDRKQHRFTWAHDWPLFDSRRMSKKFGTCSTPAEWLDLRRQHRIRGAYEVQRHGQPFKVWFDAEAERGGDFQHTNDECLKKAFELVLEALKGVGLYSAVERVDNAFMRDFVYVEAHSDVKWSVHLVSQRHYFTDHEQAKLFGDHVLMPIAQRDAAWQWLQHGKLGDCRKPIIDCGVYTKNRQVRLEGQGKLDVQDWSNNRSLFEKRPFRRPASQREHSQLAYMTTALDLADGNGWTTIDNSALDRFRRMAPAPRSAPASKEASAHTTSTSTDRTVHRGRSEHITQADYDVVVAIWRTHGAQVLSGPDEDGFFETRTIGHSRECPHDLTPPVHHKQRPVSWVTGHTLWASCHDKTDRCGGRPIRLGELPDAKRLADERDAAVFGFTESEDAVVDVRIPLVDEQRAMCTGGSRPESELGPIKNHANLVSWAEKAYAAVCSVDDWIAFKGQLLCHMDRMYVYIGGGEQRIMYREITRGARGELHEQWSELKGRERGLHAELRPLMFRSWEHGKGGAPVLGKESVGAATLWWTWDKRCTRRSTVFEPMHFSSRFDPNHSFNMFRGLHITPEAAKQYGNPENPVLQRYLKDIMLAVLCSGDQRRYDYVLDSAAFIVQRIGVKLGTYVVFWGMPGAGKGAWYHLLMKVIGEQHCVHAQDADEVVNHFNDHLRNKLFMFMDEVDFNGAEDRMGKLRGLITEPSRLYTLKGGDSRMGPCFLNVGAGTNNQPTQLVQVGERRAVVFDSNPKLGMNQWSREDRDAVWNVPPYDLARLLYERDISKFDPERVPPNDNLRVMAAGKPLACLWFVSAIEEGALEMGRDYVVDELYELYRAWMRKNAPDATMTSAPKLMYTIATGWGLEFDSKRPQLGGVRVTMKTIPSYAVLQARLPQLPSEDELKAQRVKYLAAATAATAATAFGTPDVVLVGMSG